MTIQHDFYPGRRLVYDGALCTVRCRVDELPGTKGLWLGVEWDDPSRGKHDGVYGGVRYFECCSSQPIAASFVRQTRKMDPERTLLEAIKSKYVAGPSQADDHNTVVISGKVAEEVGFEKINKEQSKLSNLKVAIVDSMVVHGIAPRGSSEDTIKRAQEELASLCPNVVELDIGYNPVETWADVEDICFALPKLRVLKLNNVRFRDLISKTQTSSRACFSSTRELHLNECLLTPSEIIQILQAPNGPRFPSLQTLWLSHNELSDFNLSISLLGSKFESVKTVILENNMFVSLDQIMAILTIFPNTSHLSFQSNKVSHLGTTLLASQKSYPMVNNLNMSQNDIKSFSFVDLLPKVFPNLLAFRLTKNPVYSVSDHHSSAINPTETLYYLTLARLPNLKNLNYTDVTSREREEGEIYYLSVAEKDIHTTLTEAVLEDRAGKAAAIAKLETRYPRYTPLCEKHDRDNLITQLTTASTLTDELGKTSSKASSQPTYPPGSLASRLVTTTFYIVGQRPTSPSTKTSSSFTRAIPNTISTSSIFALVTREFHLPALSFKLVYESEELDPERNDTSTRSQISGDLRKAERRWDSWGDWDADALVERSSGGGGDDDGDSDGQCGNGVGDEGKWTDDGVLIKNGRRWRRREVEVMFGMKSWGDWLESGVRVCKVRVELVDRKKKSWMKS